jgi:Homeodomain
MDGAGVMDDENDQSTADPTAAGPDAYANFAFLIHSQTSLMQHLPPTVDTAMTARQKRRRTRYVYSSLTHQLRVAVTRYPSEILLTARDSPEDHAVLEAAYQENSKPDKSERMEIVKRVTLTEKEVQVCEAQGQRERGNTESFGRYGFKIEDKMTDENRDHCYLMRWYLTFATLSPKSCSTQHFLQTSLRHSHVAHLGLRVRSRIHLVWTSRSTAPLEAQAFMTF